MTKDFSNLWGPLIYGSKKLYKQWSEKKKFTFKHFIVRLLKDKTLRKILKAEKEKWFMCRKKEATGFPSEIRENFYPLTIVVPGLNVFGLRWNLYCSSPNSQIIELRLLLWILYSHALGLRLNEIISFPDFIT